MARTEQLISSDWTAFKDRRFPNAAAHWRLARASADRVGEVRLPVLRGGLRAGRLRPGRQDHRHRRRSRFAHLARLPVPQRLGHFPTGDGLASRANSVLYRAPGGASGRRIPLERAMEMVAERVQRTREATWEDKGPGRASAAPHAGHRAPGRRDARQRRELSASRNCSPRWASSRSKIRPVFDTPPRSPVWGHHSAEAGPPRSSRIWRTRIASSSKAPIWRSAIRWASSG